MCFLAKCPCESIKILVEANASKGFYSEPCKWSLVVSMTSLCILRIEPVYQFYRPSYWTDTSCANRQEDADIQRQNCATWLRLTCESTVRFCCPKSSRLGSFECQARKHHN